MVKKLEKQYVVQKILERKGEVNQRGSIKIFYKVLWQGYPQSQATWQSSTSLSRDPEVKKEIRKFNEKRKNLEKSQNLKSQKHELSLSKSEEFKNEKYTSTANLSKSLSNKKKNQLQQSFQSSKSTRAKKIIPEKNNKNQKVKPPIKEVNNKDKDVVEKILEKMRQNLIKQTNQNSFSFEEKQKKLASKMKQKIKAMPKEKKTATKSSEPKMSKSGLKKIQKQVSLREKEHEQKSKIVMLPDYTLPIVTETSGNQSTIDFSSMTQGIGRIIEQRSSDAKISPKPVEQKPPLTDFVKLELADELSQQENTIGAFKSKSMTNDQNETNPTEEQFDIKGMINCKKEYYYLVEENGKSQILSRAEILNTHPYELICFYERRINIKPAEINMMVL